MFAGGQKIARDGYARGDSSRLSRLPQNQAARSRVRVHAGAFESAQRTKRLRSGCIHMGIRTAAMRTAEVASARREAGNESVAREDQKRKEEK